MMKYIVALGVVSILALTGCNNDTKVGANDAPQAVISSDVVPHAQLPENVTPTTYRLDMVINPDDDGFKGVVEIDVNIKEATSKIWLHGKHMTVTSATANWPDGTSVPLTFTELEASEAPSRIAYLTSNEPLPAGTATLRLPYATPFNTALNSAYKVERDDEAYIVTQFEAIGAREAFPSFDEPRFKVPFSLSISSPNADFVYANTPIESSEDIGGDWTKYTFAKTRPLPTYLIAFGVGPYDVVEHDPLPATDVRDRPIPLRGITAKGSGDQIEYALKNTAGILEALEAYFGIPYPYEKLDLIAAPDYAFGAMENPGAIVYREYLLLMNESSALSQKRAYARVHSHELAHQWFGNLVTPYWWEDIWLNEAFATWMGNKGTHLWNPEGNFDRLTLNASLGAMNTDTLSTTRKVREPLERTEQVMDQFDSITYRKGGGVLDMFESYLGEEAFQKGVRLHMERYADGVATADDFFKSIADGSGDATVVEAMKSFVDQPGLPLVSGTVSCDNSASRNTVNLTQSRYAPLGSKTEQGQNWKIPLVVRLGGDVQFVTMKKLMKGSKTELRIFPAKDVCPKFVMPNANGAGYYRFTLDSETWTALLSNLDQLNAREVLSTQDSLTAAYRAGEVESAVYLDGIMAFAGHPEYDVASKAGSLVSWMYDDLPESARGDLARLISDMSADRFKRVVGTDTVEGNLLAPSLARSLIFKADDADLLAKYAAAGSKYLGLDGDPDTSAVAPNMLGNALRAAMRTRSDDAYAPLMALVKGGTSFEKGAAIGGLTATPSPDMAAKLLDVALTDTDTFTGRQASALVSTLIGNDQHRDATWDWFKTNFEAFVTTRVPDVRIGGLPGYAGVFCTLERRDEVKTFFTDNAALIPGYERSLAQTVERIELCAALTEAKGEEMVEALAAR